MPHRLLIAVPLLASAVDWGGMPVVPQPEAATTFQLAQSPGMPQRARLQRLRRQAGTTEVFNGPRGVDVDARGELFVSDYFNATIRAVDRQDRVRRIAGSQAGFADGRNDGARFLYPAGLTIDQARTIYVADSGNHRIRKITPQPFSNGWVVTTLAGGIKGKRDGVGDLAEFNDPRDVGVDGDGNVYVADTGNHLIRKITPSGSVSTLAGSSLGFADGPGSTARFSRPEGIAADSQGNIYVADTNNHRIRKITPDGTVSTLAGNGLRGDADGKGAKAQFVEPEDVAVDRAGNVYVADTGNARIRLVTPDGTVSTLAGGPDAARRQEMTFDKPAGVTVSPDGIVYVTDRGNHAIREIH